MLVDGVDLSRERGHFNLVEELENGSSGWASFEDNGATITSIVISCDAGGVAWDPAIVFYDDTGGFLDITFLGLCESEVYVSPGELCINGFTPPDTQRFGGPIFEVGSGA